MFLTNSLTKFNFFPIFSGFDTPSHHHHGLTNPGTPVPSMDNFFLLGNASRPVWSISYFHSYAFDKNTQFPQDDLSSAEIVFHREAARAQRDHVFCSHKKDSVDHSVLIFQPPKKDSLRDVQAKSGQVDCTQCYVLFSHRSLLPEIQIPSLLNVVNI